MERPIKKYMTQQVKYLHPEQGIRDWWHTVLHGTKNIKLSASADIALMHEGFCLGFQKYGAKIECISIGISGGIMPYLLTVSQDFEAAHYLSGYPGNCANIHGHTWKVEITISGSQLDSVGMLVDFRDIRKELKAVLAQFDHVLINEVAPFDKINPTSENLACFIYQHMKGQFAHCRLESVKVWESDHTWAAYGEEE